MKNRIAEVLKNWNTTGPIESSETKPVYPVSDKYPLPRAINMLMPVELCISKDLLVTLLSVSIQEMHRHREARRPPSPDAGVSELEAALQQQLAFRAWARRHPASYISIAMYPTSEMDTLADLEDLEDF